MSNPATGMPGVHFYPALDRNRNEALPDSAPHDLQVTGFSAEDTVEHRIDGILGDGVQPSRTRHCAITGTVGR